MCCGALSPFCFAPYDIWPLALVVLAPLYALAWRQPPRRAFVCGHIYGMFIALAGMYWLMVVMTSHGRMDWISAGVVMLIVMLYGGLFFGFFTFMIAWCGTRWWVVLAAPLFWVAHEYVRSIFFTGIPWCPFGQTMAGFLPLAQSAEWWSVPGLSAFVVLVNGLVAWAAAPGAPARKAGSRIAAGLAALLIVGGLWGWGSHRMGRVEEAMAAAPKLPVTVAQANIDLHVLHNRAHASKVVRRIIDLTRQQAAQVKQRPWLVVWPETAAPFYFMYEAEPSGPILAEAGRLKAFITLGSTGLVSDGAKTAPSNRTWLVSPGGVAMGYYDKAHLVPFGEYVPYSNIFFFVRAIAAVGADLKPGKPGTVLHAGPAKLGALICYESIFPYLARAMHRAGANLLVNQTNDAWFGRTSAPHQHLSHLVLRCIETRLACARAANTGVSAFVLPDGRITHRSGIFEPAAATAELPLMKMDTFFSRHGDYLGPGGLAASLILLIWGWVRRRRNKEG